MPTKIVSASTTTNTVFGGSVTSAFSTPVDLYATEVLYKARFAATYEFRLDGVLVNSVSIASGVTGNLLAGLSLPYTIPRGKHTIKVNKIGGSSGWYFRSGDCWIDPPWFSVGHWQEAGGAEIGGWGVTADPDPDIVLLEDGPSTASWIISGTARAGQTYTITWNVPVIAYGIILGIGSTIPDAELLINGVQKGTLGAFHWGRDINLPGVNTMIVLDTPFEFAAGVAYTIVVRRTDLVTCGYNYVSSPTPTNTYFSQTEWQEAMPTSPSSPAIHWLFELAPIVSGSSSAMLLLP